MDEVLARVFPEAGTLAHGASKTFTFSGGFNGVLFGFHGSASGEFFALQIGATENHCAHKFLTENVSFTATDNANTLTLTNNTAAGTATLRMLCFTGQDKYTIS
jgi:hypothetical protein